MNQFNGSIHTWNYEEYQCHQKQLATIKTIIENIQEKRPLEKPPIVIITGSPGSGKTTMARMLLKLYKYDIVDFQPSAQNTHKIEIQRLYNILCGSSIFSMIEAKQKAVLFDDIDIGSNGDRGFLNDVLCMAEKKKKIHKKWSLQSQR